MEGVAAALNLSTRQVHTRLRRYEKNRLAASKPQLIDKFKETTCRLIFASCHVAFGLSALWSKPWAWTLSLCWQDWPRQPWEPSIR